MPVVTPRASNDLTSRYSRFYHLSSNYVCCSLSADRSDRWCSALRPPLCTVSLHAHNSLARKRLVTHSSILTAPGNPDERVPTYM